MTDRSTQPGHRRIPVPTHWTESYLKGRIPAQLRRTENRPSLALPASGPREAAWQYALQKIERLKL